MEQTELAQLSTKTVTESLMNEIGSAVAALAFAVRSQSGIDNDKLTEDMEEFLSRFSRERNLSIPHAWKILRLS